MEKLIIIRGPSGVGKSSVAKALKEKTDRPTMLIEQDIFRTFSNEETPNNLPVHEMVEVTTLIALKHGFDVILEGILNVQKPGRREMYERIFKAHPAENYIFYMEASFDETVRRHGARLDKKDKFGADDMREWYGLASPMQHPEEVIIQEGSSLEETVAIISRVAGLNLTKPA